MALVHRNHWLHDISVDARIEFPIVLSRLVNTYIHQFLHFRFHLFSYMPLYEAHLFFLICLFCIYFDFVLGNSKKIRLQCFRLPSLNHHRLTLIVRMNPAPSLRGGRKGEGGVGGLNPYDWYSDYFMENACEWFLFEQASFRIHINECKAFWTLRLSRRVVFVGQIYFAQMGRRKALKWCTIFTEI